MTAKEMSEGYQFAQVETYSITDSLKTLSILLKDADPQTGKEVELYSIGYMIGLLAERLQAVTDSRNAVAVRCSLDRLAKQEEGKR